MLASTFWHAFARGNSSGDTSSGERQLGLDLRSGVEALCTASMRRGTVSAANMSPVPEKKRGSAGVSIRKRRGLKSEVAVEPMIVRFSGSSTCTEASEGEAVARLDVGQEDGCEVSAEWSVGVCWPDGGLDGARDGVLEGRVWLSRVRRSEVMMICGTWYVLWRTWIAAAREFRSVMVMSESVLMRGMY